MRVAFYAPMKAPTHPVPSGDRRIARLFMQALAKTGAAVSLASDFRSFDGRGDAARQAELQAQGLAIADQLIADYQNLPAGGRPELWFSYHLYHKAPDWLGPKVSAALGIPYIVAEASHAPKQAGGAWDPGYRAAATAIAAATRVLAMTQLDMACLQTLIGEETSSGPEKLIYFPPFIDKAPFSASAKERAKWRREMARRHGLDQTRTWLLAVAMMRPGDKLRSYQVLAASLDKLSERNWQAVLIGDGAARDAVAALFQHFSDQVKLVAAQELEGLLPYYGASDIYVWPAVNEAYGMAFLEAQATGLPVVAGGEPGVGEVVRDGISGLLSKPRDAVAFAGALDRLLADTGLKKSLAKGASDFINSSRDVTNAAEKLAEVLREI